LNPAVDRVGTTTVNRAIGPVDGLVTVRAEDVETMYPVILQRAIDGISPLNTLERDDEAALSALYPNETALSPTGTVAGSIFIPCAAEDETAGICIAGADGRRVKRAQGVLVTARRFEPSSPNPDLDGDAVPDPRVLKEAVSQLTGVTFAPLRCITPNRLQIFGACSTLGSVEECSQTLENFGVATQCGFFSSGFSAPRPVGDAAENRFELTDLPPGQYIVEATQVFTGGFSSPVLSNFSATPLIVSDDNRGFAFFPNPQTGEFYNGLPNGCGSPTAICGGESGSVPDNPFAYTIIEVTAGGRVEDVNIVLNTTTTATNFLSTPGFNFCGLGDVNGDAIVDQRDVQKVATARAAFEKAQRRSRKKVRRVLRRNPRSDLNQDSSITAFDVDIITDIVTLPEFTGKDINRALAPFAAICTAARDGGCSIQAPTAATRNDGTVLLPVCDTAMDIGCSVIGCQPFQPVGCTAISVPAEQNGELSLSDPASFIRTDSFADCYTFSGTAGQPLVIRLQSQNFDTVLTLIGPDGQIVDSNDDCPGDGVNSCIPSGALSGQVVSLPSTGTYTIEVTSFAPQATGGYSLTVSDEPFNPQPGSTTAEGALASSDQVLGDGSFADPFTFTGNAGQQVSFRLQSTEFDTFLLLVGPDGQAVDANDNCPGDGTNSCIPSNTLSGGLLSLPSDGTYIVVVNSVAPGATGGYTLTASGGISIQPLSP
ncbi:MAG: pre-peptidase C-terminal domain-containing protein, partial [Candidatus Binatia bacterium]